MFTSNNANLTKQIKAAAIDIGFHLVGITSAKPSEHLDHYRRWLEKGFHGEMSYLQKHLERKSDPKKVLPSVRSIICCALSYHTEVTNPLKAKSGHGLVSNYAWGDDYHKIMQEKLDRLLSKIKEWVPHVEAKRYADTGPILERSFSERAGLGWIGKNTCVINQEYGSYIFLGEILVSVDLTEDSAETDHCGSCTACLDACPTDAFVGPYQLDAERCISYITIEKRGALKPEEKEMIGDHIFGCDICQQVCPWNDKAARPNLSFFQPRAGNYEPALEALSQLSEEAFREKFKKSPIKRAKYEGFQRNVRVVRAHSPCVSK